jgi:hypothetical protein
VLWGGNCSIGNDRASNSYNAWVGRFLMVKALDGINVVKLFSHLGVLYAAMVLAEHGARTFKVERPGGEEGRGTPHNVLNLVSAACFLASIARGSHGGARTYCVADVVVSGFVPSRERALRLDYDSIRLVSPLQSLESEHTEPRTGSKKSAWQGDSLRVGQEGRYRGGKHASGSHQDAGHRLRKLGEHQPTHHLYVGRALRFARAGS